MKVSALGLKKWPSNKKRAKIIQLRRSHGVFWKKAREAVSMTQAEVAHLLGYKNGQFISNVEGGRCRYPGDQLPRIQKIYGLKTSEIMEVVLEEEELALRQALSTDT